MKKHLGLLHVKGDTATDLIERFLNENKTLWSVELFKDNMVYYLDDDWVFQLQLNTKIFWVNHSIIWSPLDTLFGIKYEEIQRIIIEHILSKFNFYGFLPKSKVQHPDYDKIKPQL